MVKVQKLPCLVHSAWGFLNSFAISFDAVSNQNEASAITQFTQVVYKALLKLRLCKGNNKNVINRFQNWDRSHESCVIAGQSRLFFLNIHWLSIVLSCTIYYVVLCHFHGTNRFCSTNWLITMYMNIHISVLKKVASQIESLRYRLNPI